MGEEQPADVESPGTEGDHLPVQDGHRLEVAVDDVADAGVAPAQHRVALLLLRRDVGLEPGQGTLDRRRGGEVADGEVVPRADLGEVAVQQRLAVLLGREVAEAAQRVVDRVQPGQDVDGGVLESALVGPVGVEEPVVTEGVGQHVGRDDALDAVHEEAGSAQHLAGLLQPAHAGDRDVGELADLADDLVLVAELVAREDREVLGRRRDAGDHGHGVAGAALGPGRVEDQRLRRHAVAVDAAVQHHLRLGVLRQQAAEPPLQHLGHAGRIAAAALHLQVCGRWRLGHDGRLLRPDGVTWVMPDQNPRTCSTLSTRARQV